MTGTGDRKEWRIRLKALSNIPLLLRLCWEAAPVVVVIGLVARLVGALVPLGVFVIARHIVDDTVGVVAHGAAVTRALWWLVGAELALASLGVAMWRVIRYADFMLGERFTLHLSVRTLRHAATLDLASFEDPAFHDKLSRARLQAIDRVNMLRDIGRLIQAAITVVALALAISAVSIWCFLLIVVCQIPAFLADSHYAFAAYSLRTSQTPARRRLDYLRHFGASRENAQEQKLFQLAEHWIERYREISRTLMKEDARLHRRRLIAGIAFSVIGAIGQYAAYGVALYETLYSGLSVGTFTFLVGAIAATSQGIQTVFEAFSGIADEALFVTDLHDFFAMQPKIRSRPGARQVPRPIKHGFELRNVSFGYPNRPAPVLDNISLELRAGERVALIGENGQGKTTLLKLLLQLYEPTSGQILLDGVDLREYDLHDLHGQISVIFQDFVRYQMTFAENIAFGNIDRSDRAAIEEAARKSLAHDVAERLPKGYDQLLGRLFEGGVDLSGGEWQKVALARAYLRDAQFLVLDEPTAALDAKVEHEVFQRFAELTIGRTALFISHRFSTVRMADRILVLQGGKITEDGSHTKLMALGGHYAKLFDLQAAQYQ